MFLIKYFIQTKKCIYFINLLIMKIYGGFEINNGSRRGDPNERQSF